MRACRWFVVAAMLLALWACSSDEKKALEPVDLVPVQNAIELNRLWQAQVGDGLERRGLQLFPAYRRGSLYVASSDGKVTAVDAESGQQQWLNEIDIEITGGVGLGGDHLFVGGGDGELFALDAATGDVDWQTRVSSEVLAAPDGDGDIVVVRAQDGRVFGIDDASGERRWVFDRDMPLLTVRGNAPPMIDGTRVLVPFDNGKLYALELADGAIAWEQTIAPPEGRSELERLVDIDGQLASRDGQLYAVTFQGRIVALDAATGQLIWVRDMSSHRNPADTQDALFVVDDQSRLVALDRRNGGELWSNETLLRRIATGPATLGDRVIVGDLDGYLHWFATDSGRYLARTRIDGDAIVVPPLVIGNTLYAISSSGRMAAYRP